MGHSCGAIYAMACALRLKPRIVGTVWLMSPWVHLTIAKRMKWIRHVPTTLLKTQSTAGLLYKSLSVAAKEPPCKSDPNILNYDREKLVKAMLQDNMAECLEGANNDLMVCLELYHSFGFSYKDVTLPVHVFWGTKVTIVGVSGDGFVYNWFVCNEKERSFLTATIRWCFRTRLFQGRLLTGWSKGYHNAP